MTPAPAEVEADNVTLGEIGRNVAKLTSSMEKLSEKVEQYPKWADVQRIEAQLRGELTAAVEQRKTEYRNLAQDVAELAAWKTWALRTIMALVIAAVIGAILVVKP